MEPFGLPTHTHTHALIFGVADVNLLHFLLTVTRIANKVQGRKSKLRGVCSGFN